MSVEEGRRFSLNYVARGEPSSDSERMRRRVYRLFDHLNASTDVTRATVELAIGVSVPVLGYGGHWEKFFTKCELRDFLDLITVVATLTSPHTSNRWLSGVRTILEQENVGYRVDEKGGVHFAIDAEFTHNQVSAIAALQSGRYNAVRAHFEAGQKAMDATPPATREAIRQTFEAAETLFKLMFPDTARLGSSDAAKKLRPLLEIFKGTERDSAGRMLVAFQEWVNGAHPYRHGQGVEEPDNPGMVTTVLSVSLGASFIRWLAEMDDSEGVQARTLRGVNQ